MGRHPDVRLFLATRDFGDYGSRRRCADYRRSGVFQLQTRKQPVDYVPRDGETKIVKETRLAKPICTCLNPVSKCFQLEHRIDLLMHMKVELHLLR